MISLSSGSVIEQPLPAQYPPATRTPPKTQSISPVTPVPQIIAPGLPLVDPPSPEKTQITFKRPKSFLGSLRKFVSGSRSRLKEDGFDLDLSYITNRIIAMGFPAKGLESTYRNPRSEVVLFLKKRHQNRYLVFNLCAEHKCQYDSLDFGHPHAVNGAIMIPVLDHTPPSLVQLSLFVQKALNWLNQHPDNVIVVHCLAGKGRTGVFISALLLASRVCSSASLAIDMFNTNRGGTGVKIPSQIRVLNFFEELLIMSANSIPIAITALSVSKTLWTLDSIELGPVRFTSVSSILVRPRSIHEYQSLDLPLLPSTIDHLNTLKIDLRQSRFTSQEDTAFTIKFKKSKINFWFFSELTQTMLDHRISQFGNSTMILTGDELDDHPEIVDIFVKVNVTFNRV